MSWSLYFTAVNTDVATKHVEQQREPTKDQPWGLPRYAKDLILATLAACQIPPDYAVKVEASGHQPSGGHKIEVQPTFIVTG